MEDAVDTAQRLTDGIRVADVSGDQLDLGVEIVGTAPLGPVYLRIEVVKDANAVTLLEECIGDMRSNEPCAPRDQHSSAHSHHTFLGVTGVD
jgi:hypothetical protein